MSMKEKILIYGKGWIGEQIFQYLSANAEVFFGKARIENYKDVSAELDNIKPNIVINAAGKTGDPNIDWCLEHQMETITSNITGAMVLAKACSERHIYLVHLSTGCLWNEYKTPCWQTGFNEHDEPRPNSFYSTTKAAGESAICLFEGTFLILRIRLPFNGVPHKRNLFTKLLKIPDGGVLVNEPNSLTCVPDFIVALEKLIQIRATGIYHVANSGHVTNSEILSMCARFGVIDKIPNLEMIDKDEFNKRKITKDGRSNCILDTSKLQATGIMMRHCQYALEDCLASYRSSPRWVVS